MRPLLDFLCLQGSGTRGIEASAGTVIEIGPGGGVLTVELLRAGARVLALELDPRWAFTLAHRLSAECATKQIDEAEIRGTEVRGTENRGAGISSAEIGGVRSRAWALSIGDALDLDWSRLEATHQVVGNLPYGVATAILRRALASAVAGVRLGFLVQLEVAQRICAVPGDAQYGALSVQVRARTGGGVKCKDRDERTDVAVPPLGEARILGRVKPGSFVPPPKVDSAFVGLRLVEPAVGADHWADFCRLVFAGFSQRRKTVRNSLGSQFPRSAVGAALERAAVGPRQRAEELDVAAWVRIFDHLVRP